MSCEQALLRQAAGDLAEIIEHYEDGDERHLERAVDEARATYRAIRREIEGHESMESGAESRGSMQA